MRVKPRLAQPSGRGIESNHVTHVARYLGCSSVSPLLEGAAIGTLQESRAVLSKITVTTRRHWQRSHEEYTQACGDYHETSHNFSCQMRCQAGARGAEAKGHQASLSVETDLQDSELMYALLFLLCITTRI